MKIITDEKCAGYSRYGHPERPARLKSQSELPVEWLVPTKAADKQILRAHAPEMLARLKIPVDFDADTPAYENISEYARASIAAAAPAALKTALVAKMLKPARHIAPFQMCGFQIAKGKSPPQFAIFQRTVVPENQTMKRKRQWMTKSRPQIILSSLLKYIRHHIKSFDVILGWKAAGQICRLGRHQISIKQHAVIAEQAKLTPSVRTSPVVANWV